MILPIRKILIAAMLCLGAAAHAFKVPTHVATANAALDDMMSTLRASPAANMVHFHGLTLDLTNLAAYNAVLDNPDYFRAGVVGPDAFPDMVSGQMYLHTNHGELASTPTLAKTHHEVRYSTTYRSIDFAMALLKKAKAKNDNAAIAFALGYIGHCVGDGFAHTYVNEQAGGSWDYLKGDGLFGSFTEEIKHMATEGFLDAHVPNRLRNTGTATNFNRMNLKAPYDMLDEYFNTVSKDPCPKCDIAKRINENKFPDYNGGRIYNYFQAQVDVVSYLRQNAGNYLGAMKNLPGLPNTSTGAKAALVGAGMTSGVAAILAPLVADMIVKYGQIVLPKSYLNEVSTNLDQLVAKIGVYRRNWLVMSKCVQENVVKGHAVGNVDNCPEAKAELTYANLNTTNRALFEPEFRKLFDPLPAGEDHHKVFTNVKRQARYLQSSFMLDEITGAVIPADLQLAWQNIKEILKQEAVRYALNGLIKGVMGPIEGVVCAAKTVACSGECLADRCIGGMVGCESRMHTMCAKSAKTCLPWPADDVCGTDWYVQYPICMAGSAAYCGITSTFDCGKCGLGCAQETAICAAAILTTWDYVNRIEQAMAWVQAQIDAVKAQINDYVVKQACKAAKDYGLPVDELYKIAATYKSMEDGNTTPQTVVNLVFLKEDINPNTQEGKDWYNAIMSQGLSAEAKSFITAVRNGEAKSFISNRVNEAGAFPIATPANCLTFDNKGAYDGDPIFAELRTLQFFRNNAGPTATRFQIDLGMDMAADFMPFYNTVQGLKLAPLNSKGDIEKFFTKAGASLTNLPWKLAQADYNLCVEPKYASCKTANYSCLSKCSPIWPLSLACEYSCNQGRIACNESARTSCATGAGPYSNVCVADATVNPFCDAIPSLDDPNCIGCTEKPITLPLTKAMLEKNLETDATADKWVRKRSLVSWNEPSSGIPDALTYVNNQFMFSTNPDIRDKLYKKIFVLPGEGIRRWRSNVLSPISPLIIEAP